MAQADDLLSQEERDILAAGAPAEDTTADDGAAAVTAAAAAAEDPPKDDDAAPVETAPERPEAPAVFVPQYQTAVVPDDRLAELRKAGQDLRKRWSNGELDDEEYNAQAIKLDAERDEAAAAQIRAQVRNELSAETAKQSFDFQRSQFLKTAEKYDGVPYMTNEIVRGAFDRELSKAGQRAIESNPDATAEELFIEADKAVREQFAALGTTFGKKTAAASASAAATPAAAITPRNVPKTLSGMPAAAPIDTGSQAQLSQLATLEGEDFEMAVAKLAPAERRRLMDSAN